MAENQEQQAAEQPPSLVEQLLAELAELTATDPDSLVRRDALGTVFSFEDGRSDFEKILQLYKDLASLPKEFLHKVPDEQIEALRNQVSEAQGLFRRIQEFSPEQENAAGVRNALLGEVHQKVQPHFREIAWFIAYGRPEEIDLQASKQEAQQALHELKSRSQEQIEYIDTTRVQIEDMADKARTAAATVGVATHAEIFKIEADKHQEASRTWLLALGGLLVALAGFGAWLIFGNPTTGSSDLSLFQYLERATPRIIILTVLLYAIRTARHIYASHMHNQVLNTHRQNALSTFETFVGAAGDPATKDAVLFEAARSIFTVQPSGHLQRDGEGPDVSQLVEIVRRTAERGQD